MILFMKKNRFTTAIFAVASFFFVFVPVTLSYSLPSKFEGKIVKKIEFVGIKKYEGGFQIVPIKNVGEKDLQTVCLTEKGYPLNAKELQDDIRAVFNEGQFMDVQVEVMEYQDGVVVRFLCDERPSINRIIYRGLDELGETDLVPNNEDILKEGDAFRKDIVEKHLELVKKKYVEEGFFNVIVTYEIVPSEGKKPEDNLVDLIIKVDEGEEIKINKITIFGAHKVNDARLLEIMELKEKEIFTDGKFQTATYEMDKQKILMFYRQEGYLDADIISDSVDYEWEDPEKKEARGIYITIKVHEGERYYFDKYTIEGNQVIETDYLMNKLTLKHAVQTPVTRNVEKALGWFGVKFDHDTVCNDTLFQQDRYMMAFEYGKKGYLFTRVIPAKNITEREVVVNGKKVMRKYVHYNMKIVEGNQAYVENIIIKGNKETKDKVIRRELTFKEGELYNAEEVQKSREVLFKLGYFQEVNIDIRPGSSDEKVNLIVSVVEASTGTLSLGGGYSTATGFSIFANTSEKNLLGYGYTIYLNFEYGPYKTGIQLGFIDPWFLDYPVEFATEVFYYDTKLAVDSIYDDGGNDYAYYNTMTFGYALGFAYKFKYNYLRIGARWRHSFSQIHSPTGNNYEDVFRLEKIGLQEKRQVTLYTSYDDRDSMISPTKGIYAYFGVTFTGGPVLWGDDHYIRYNPSIEWFKTLFTVPYIPETIGKYPFVLQLRASGKFTTPTFGSDIIRNNQNPYDNPWLEQADKLFVGGATADYFLRGWEYYMSDLPKSWRYGLFHQILYGGEIRFPLHPQFLWMAFFFDAGALWSDTSWDRQSLYYEYIAEGKESKEVYDIKDFYKVDPLKYFKYSYGLGFRVQIPMLPLRFWWGKRAIWKGFTEGGLDTISDMYFQLQIGDSMF